MATLRKTIGYLCLDAVAWEPDHAAVSRAEEFWVLASVIPAVAATHWGVILREERYLKAKFGEAYGSYASRV